MTTSTPGAPRKRATRTSTARTKGTTSSTTPSTAKSTSSAATKRPAKGTKAASTTAAAQTTTRTTTPKAAARKATRPVAPSGTGRFDASTPALAAVGLADVAVSQARGALARTSSELESLRSRVEERVDGLSKDVVALGTDPVGHLSREAGKARTRLDSAAGEAVTRLTGARQQARSSVAGLAHRGRQVVGATLARPEVQQVATTVETARAAAKGVRTSARRSADATGAQAGKSLRMGREGVDLVVESLEEGAKRTATQAKGAVTRVTRARRQA